MCGITGIYAFNMVGAFNMINIAKATEILKHRGPDYQGMYNDDIIAMGHQRLAVIDPGIEGNQPMWDASGRYMIIYNGEIYNFSTLKQKLLEEGIEFHSKTDTEVLLYLLIKEGIKALDHLNGFFAFAFYDRVEQTVLLARDRLGIKPLYYYHDEDKVIFASEMQSILEYGLEKEIDFTALYHYLQLNYIPAPLTILKSVKKLMPGHYLKISKNDISIDQYFKINENLEEFSGTYEEAKSQLKDLVEQSVEDRLIADVPLGAFLSGGVDSSIIAALAKKHKPDIHTFSIGYKNEKFFDETAYARLAAKEIGSEHEVFSLSNQDLFDHLYDVLDHMDEPFADSSSLAVYILSKETRKHATVALSGDGADELFAGYNKHRAWYRMLQGKTSDNLVKTLTPLWSLMPKSRSSFLTNKTRQLYRYGSMAKLDPRSRYWALAAFCKEEEAKFILNAESCDKIDIENYNLIKDSYLDDIKTDTINEILMADLGFVLPNDMLKKVDLMSMSHGLEVRVPFLDHKLVNFVTSLPDRFKIDDKISKKILKDSFSDILPDKIYNRPKKGFEVPLLKWLRKDLKKMIKGDLLSKQLIEKQGIFEYKKVNRLRKKLYSMNPGDSHARIWGLIVFQWWWKKNFL